MDTERDLNVTTDHNNILKHNLTSLEQEFRDLNTTVIQWHRELKNHFSGGITGKPIKEEFFSDMPVHTMGSLLSHDSMSNVLRQCTVFISAHSSFAVFGEF